MTGTNPSDQGPAIRLLLFYRNGDFYVCSSRTPKIASRTLVYRADQRGKHHGLDITPCAGVPVGASRGLFCTA